MKTICRRNNLFIHNQFRHKNHIREIIYNLIWVDVILWVVIILSKICRVCILNILQTSVRQNNILIYKLMIIWIDNLWKKIPNFIRNKIPFSILLMILIILYGTLTNRRISSSTTHTIIFRMFYDEKWTTWLK